MRLRYAWFMLFHSFTRFVRDESDEQLMSKQQQTLTDLEGKVGSKGYVYSILNRRKPLTLELAKLFHKELKIPAETLLS